MATDVDIDAFLRASLDEQSERMHNATSFTEIPDEQMPWDKWIVRRVLLALELRALSGHDCYAYRPANQRDYVIWDRQPDPATESRFSPHAWAIKEGFFSADHGKEGA